MVVEGVGAGHRPECLVGAEVVQADDTLLPRARTTRDLLQGQAGVPVGAFEASKLAAIGAAMSDDDGLGGSHDGPEGKIWDRHPYRSGQLAVAMAPIHGVAEKRIQDSAGGAHHLYL